MAFIHVFNRVCFGAKKCVLGSTRTLTNTKQMSSVPSYENILVDKRGEKNNIGLITLNRPKINALSNALMNDFSNALDFLDKDESIAVIVLTGSEKFFAAGSDISEMMDRTFAQCTKNDYLAKYDKLLTVKKPVIAAVNGYALGGGCELAMMSDIIYAGDQAKFGQPEILVGLIPGAGGTQRLPKLIGKSRAMEMMLSGENISASEAHHWGLVNRVFPADKVVGEAIKLGEKIARNSKITVSLCKSAVNHSFETTLHEGLSVEKSIFQSTFATNDRKEGMTAFFEKRPANFTDS